MADYNASVALGTNAPDPNQSLNTLSKIMTLGSQGLGIRGQQSQNQSLAAKASIDTQTAKENGALAQLMSDPIKNGLVDQDGNPTKNAQTIVMQAAPTTGQDHYEKLVSAATKKVAFNSAVNSLRTSERTEIGQGIQGVVARAESPDDVTGAIDSLVDSKKGTPEYANYQTIGGTMKEAINHLAKQTNGNNPPPQGKEPWKIGAANMAASIGGVTPTAQTTGAGVVNRDPILGGLSQPPGAPTGSAINPTPPQVAGATSRQVQGAGADIDRANKISGNVQASSAAIPLTQHIDDLSEQIQSGKFAASISKAAAAVGLSDSTYARQVLEKELGQVKTLAIANAPSDAAAQTIQSGYPDATSDTKTIHTAMDYTRGAFRQNLARGELLNKVKSKDESLRGFQHADDIMTGSTDPLMHEFKALKTPAERIGFYQRNFTDPAKAQDFRDKVAGMGHVIGQ